MPYSKIDPEAMILRDHLAYERTVLANERTLLSYFRTGIALLASGGMLLKLFPEVPAIKSVGYALVGLGGAALVTGVVRFSSVKKRLARTYQKLENE